MDGRASSGIWLKFFTNAGIPESVSASYANKFAENRIKRDMIRDLTKDILRDMGVTCMGDIIAILRHAKEVYDEEILERVIGQSSSNVQTATVRPTKVSSGRKSSPSSRLQDHYLWRPSTSADSSSTSVAAVEEAPALPERIKSTSHRETRSSTSGSSIEKVFRKQQRSSGASEVASQSSRKRSVTSSGGQSLRKADSSSELKRKQADEVPVKKARRVLPEHEGGYKITMPSGTTARTQEILRKKALLNAAQKKSVFDRLGAGSEEEVATPATNIADTTFRVTGLNSVPFITATSNPKSSSSSSSVFSRLGDKSQQPTTSKTTSDVSTPNSLAYHGILKQSNKKVLVKTSVTPSSRGSTMRADVESLQASRKKATSFSPSITTVILPMSKVEGRRLITAPDPASSVKVRGYTMRADEEVRAKVAPVVKRLHTSIPQAVAAPSLADKPIMRQVFRNRVTQGILAAPTSHLKMSVKSRLGVGSNSPERATEIVPERKKVMFEKREVSFAGASGKFASESRSSKVTVYKKPVRFERRVPYNFKKSVFNRLGRNQGQF